MKVQLFEDDLITTGLWKEGWILATPSKENSNLERIQFANRNDLYFPVVSEKKASEIHGCENRDFTALLLFVLPNFLQISCV